MYVCVYDIVIIYCMRWTRKKAVKDANYRELKALNTIW